jgi:hypothetical protein
MNYETDTEELKSQIRELRAWIGTLMRRIEDLESSAFQLQDHEEVILVTMPNEDRRQRML